MLSHPIAMLRRKGLEGRLQRPRASPREEHLRSLLQQRLRNPLPNALAGARHQHPRARKF